MVSGIHFPNSFPYSPFAVNRAFGKTPLSAARIGQCRPSMGKRARAFDYGGLGGVRQLQILVFDKNSHQ